MRKDSMVLILYLTLGLILFVTGIWSYYKIDRNKKLLYPQTIATESSTESSSLSICSTENCTEASGYEPCDNFSKWACGKSMIETVEDKTHFHKNSVNENMIELKSYLERDHSANRTMGINLAKDLYQFCMDNETRETQGIKPVVEVIRRYGGWPVTLGQNWDEENWDWSDTIAKMFNDGFIDISILDFTAKWIWKNHSEYVLTIEQPMFKMNYTHLLENRIPYYKLMVDVAVSFGASKSAARLEMARVFSLKIELAKNAILANYTDDVDYETVKISEIQAEYPYIDWMQFIRSMLPKNVTIDVDLEIEFEICEYFERLELTLKQTRKRTIANYLIWEYILHSLDFLTAELYQRKIDAFAAIGEKPTFSTRDDMCFDYVKRYLTVALGNLYIHENSRRIVEARAVTMEIANNIRDEFIKMLQAVDWMDNEAKDGAIEKVKFMNIIIAYSDDPSHEMSLKQYYDGLELISNNFYQSFLRISRFNIYREFRKQIGSQANVYIRESWSAGASYFLQGNIVFIPAAVLLKKPFADWPSYMNYGTIGHTIAHEIAHGFTTPTHTLDALGNSIDWSEDTENKFTSKCQCFKMQYSKVKTELGYKLDGEKTLDENMADNIGIKVAYRAYQSLTARNGIEPLLAGLENYTQHQSFWIALAQKYCAPPTNIRYAIQTEVHTPYPYRVPGMLKNMPEFAKDYECSSKSLMFLRETERCEIY